MVFNFILVSNNDATRSEDLWEVSEISALSEVPKDDYDVGVGNIHYFSIRLIYKVYFFVLLDVRRRNCSK